MADNPSVYIGDGVYVIFEGYGFWLYAHDPRNPTDTIYLELSVFHELVDAVKRFVEPTRTTDDTT